jgi:hypothetical protein
MPSSEKRRYVVTVSRLMIGGRVFSKGDAVAIGSGPLYSLVRTGALRALPLGMDTDIAPGICIDLDEQFSGQVNRAG